MSHSPQQPSCRGHGSCHQGPGNCHGSSRAALLSQDQQAECLRAGGSKALKGEPPPGRLLPPPHILTAALSFLLWHRTPAASSPQPHTLLDLLPKRGAYSLAHQRLHNPSCPQSHPDTLSVGSAPAPGGFTPRHFLTRTAGPDTPRTSPVTYAKQETPSGVMYTAWPNTSSAKQILSSVPNIPLEPPTLNTEGAFRLQE